jgi:hypothetical protein
MGAIVFVVSGVLVLGTVLGFAGVLLNVMIAAL